MKRGLIFILVLLLLSACNSNSEPNFITNEEIQEMMGLNELLDVNFQKKNKELKLIVDLVPNPDIPDESDDETLATVDYMFLSDDLLKYKGWDILTVEYKDRVTVSVNRSMQETSPRGNPQFSIDTVIEGIVN